MRQITRLSALTLTLIAAPGLALAHPGHEVGSALLSGLAHPFGGLDHLLAMVAVGIWGASLGGNSRWQMPAAFVGAMVAGAGLGLAGLIMPLVQPMILASSVLIGLALALALNIGAGSALAVTGLFGLMHGYAHGVEAPATGLLAYGFGFVAATAALHVAGLLLGRLAINRWLGAATAAAGLALAMA